MDVKQTSSRTIKYNEPRIKLLAGQFKHGDKETFTEIWESVRPFISRLMRRGLDWNTADDLTGEVAASLYEHGISDYDPSKCGFITWVYQIALNKKLDEFKRFKPVFFSQMDRRAKEASGGAGPVGYGSHQPTHITVIDNQRSDNKTPLNILIDREDDEIRAKARELLPELLALLTPDEQYLIYASIYEGRTDKEISFILAGGESFEKKYQKIRERAVKKLGRLFVRHGIRNVPLEK
jgi:RNA polymerase sigma factor (sigma-70 family)